jgi:hypothetical protein
VVDGFWKKAWYLFLIVVYSVGYFVYAVASGIWGWAKEMFSEKDEHPRNKYK